MSLLLDDESKKNMDELQLRLEYDHLASWLLLAGLVMLIIGSIGTLISGVALVRSLLSSYFYWQEMLFMFFAFVLCAFVSVIGYLAMRLSRHLKTFKREETQASWTIFTTAYSRMWRLVAVLVIATLLPIMSLLAYETFNYYTVQNIDVTLPEPPMEELEPVELNPQEAPFPMEEGDNTE